MVTKTIKRGLYTNDFPHSTALDRIVNSSTSFDLSKEIWDERPINEVRRWGDVVMLYHWDDGGDDPHKQYVKRSDIVDPLFWIQPITREWIRELSRMVENGV